MADRIHIEIDADAKKVVAASAEAVTAVKSVEKAVDDSSRTTRNATKDTDKYTVSVKELSNATGILNRNAAAFRNTVGFIKFPALIAGVGALAQGANAAAA